MFELKSRFVSQKLHRLRVHSVSNVMNIITILTVANFKSGPMTVEQTCENLFIYIYVFTFGHEKYLFDSIWSYHGMGCHLLKYFCPIIRTL